MNADRIVHSVAGGMVLASLALTRWHHPNWIWLTVFVGANLLQSGLTNWCLLTRILAKLGVPTEGTCGISRA